MSAKAAIYLDANAGAPLKPEVSQVLAKLLSLGSSLHNPSSVHSHGRHAKRFLSRAREQVCTSLGPKFFPESLTFTSSGTESNQLAIRLALEPLFEGSRVSVPHWVLSAVEHDSVFQMVKWFEAHGGEVSFIPVDREGRPQMERLAEVCRKNTALVSLLWVNNETGVISDLARAAEICRERGLKLHVDAAQAWGKLPFGELPERMSLAITLSGHKIGALAGTGALWLSPEWPVKAPLPSTVFGKQERGIRGGTENLLGIISMGAAAETLEPRAWSERVHPVRDRLESLILDKIEGVIVNGGGAPRVANTLSLNFAGVERDGLVAALDLAGYSVSSGSACSSGVAEASHVLMAMGRTSSQAKAALRVSLVDELDETVLQGFVRALSEAVSRARSS